MIFKSNESFSLPKLNSDKFVTPAKKEKVKYVIQLFVTKEGELGEAIEAEI